MYKFLILRVLPTIKQFSKWQQVNFFKKSFGVRPRDLEVQTEEHRTLKKKGESFQNIKYMEDSLLLALILMEKIIEAYVNLKETLATQE